MECSNFAFHKTTIMIKNILLGLCCVLLFSTCRKDENYLFTMDYDQEFTILPALSPAFGIHGVRIDDIQSRISTYLANNGISEDEVVKITSGSARISAVLPGPGYGFIERAEIYISKPNDPGDRRLVFERLAIPQNTGEQLELVGSLINSKEYLIEDAFDLNFEMRLRQTSPGLIRTRLQVEFRVHTE